MIIVRFKETFRERLPEWIQATSMLLWGLLAIGAPGVFIAQEFYWPMLEIMTQMEWGVMVAIIGVVRLIFLVINGAWRPSAHIRAVGSGMGVMLWAALLLSAINLSWLSPVVAMYTMPLGMELFSLWFSAGDAKLADLSAKGKLKVV